MEAVGGWEPGRCQELHGHRDLWWGRRGQCSRSRSGPGRGMACANVLKQVECSWGWGACCKLYVRGEGGQERPLSTVGGQWASLRAQGVGLPPAGIGASFSRKEQYWDQALGEMEARCGVEGRLRVPQQQRLGGGNVLVFLPPPHL